MYDAFMFRLGAVNDLRKLIVDDATKQTRVSRRQTVAWRN